MPKIKAILFDYDGTIRDTGYVIHDSLTAAFEHHGVVAPSREEMAPYFNHHSHVQAKFAPQISKDAFDEVYYAQKKQRVASLKLFENAKKVLLGLKAEGLQVGLVTAMKAGETLEEISKHQLEGIFDVTVGGDEVEHQKPAPDTILLALQRLGISPEEAIYVGDMVTDALAAQNAGLAGFIGITSGLATKEELKKVWSDYIVETLDEIPGLLHKEFTEIR